MAGCGKKNTSEIFILFLLTSSGFINFIVATNNRFLGRGEPGIIFRRITTKNIEQQQIRFQQSSVDSQPLQ